MTGITFITLFYNVLSSHLSFCCIVADFASARSDLDLPLTETQIRRSLRRRSLRCLVLAIIPLELNSNRVTLSSLSRNLRGVPPWEQWRLGIWDEVMLAPTPREEREGGPEPRPV